MLCSEFRFLTESFAFCCSVVRLLKPRTLYLWEILISTPRNIIDFGIVSTPITRWNTNSLIFTAEIYTQVCHYDRITKLYSFLLSTKSYRICECTPGKRFTHQFEKTFIERLVLQTKSTHAVVNCTVIKLNRRQIVFLPWLHISQGNIFFSCLRRQIFIHRS